MTAFDRVIPPASLEDVDDAIPPTPPQRNSFSRRTLFALATLAFFAVCYSATQPHPTQTPKEIPIRDAHVPLFYTPETQRNSPIQQGTGDALPLVAAKISAQKRPTHQGPEVKEPDPHLSSNVGGASDVPVPKSIPESPPVPSDGKTVLPNNELPVPKSPSLDQSISPHLFWQTIFPVLSWFFLWPFRFAFGIIYSLLSTFLFKPLSTVFRIVKFITFTVPLGILSAVSPALTFLSMAALMGALLGGTAGWMSEGISTLVCGDGNKRQRMKGEGEEEEEEEAYYDGDGERIKRDIRGDNLHVIDRGALSFEEGWGTSEDEESFDEDSYNESFAGSGGGMNVVTGSRRGQVQKTGKLNLSERVRAAEKGRQAARKRSGMQMSLASSTATPRFGIKPRHGFRERSVSPDTNLDATSTKSHRPTSSKSNRKKSTSVKKDDFLEPPQQSISVESSALRRNVGDATASRKHKKFNRQIQTSAEL